MKMVFFAGVWASNVDFEDDADIEIDYFAGYYGEINDSLSYDISYTYYTYTGYSSEDDSDYGEIILNAYIDAVTLTLGHAPDFVNSGDAAHYVSAAYDFSLANDYALTVQAGYTFGDAYEDFEYVDYSATVAKTFNGFDVSAAVINTDIDDYDAADLRFVLGVSRTF
ncbi:TorF family putative porin [Colwellia chukchiensis]|nr:TorF family putative porin [Colwellia chukchiensis]